MITNMIKMLESGELSDLTIVVGKDDDKAVFTAHKLVLLSTSGYFKKCCATDSKFKEGEDNTVNLPETDPKVFKALLHLLYTNTWDETISDEDTAKIYLAADYFDMGTVKLAAARHIDDQFKKRWRGVWNQGQMGYLTETICAVFRLYRDEDKYIYSELVKAMGAYSASMKHLLKLPDMQSHIVENSRLGLFFIEILIK